MITRELLKAEVEKVKDDYLDVLYKIIKIFEAPPKADNGNILINLTGNGNQLDWHAFIAQTYGCLSDDSFERGEQGRYEIREAMQ